MRPTIASGPKANRIGGLWMIAAMAGFAVEDALIKAASATVPLGQILMIFGAGGAAIYATMAFAAGERLYTSAVLSTPMRVRVVFEIAGRLFYALAITLTPLSSATVILQATPLVVVAGAALVFGERVGWRRWAAILIGLVGVLTIIGPGSAGFSALSIFAVLGMLGFAGRDLASRAAPASLTTSQLGVTGFLAIVVSGLAFTLWDDAALVNPSPVAWAYLTGCILSGTVAYASLMKAMRTGDVSAVTPLRYTPLLFGVALGVFVFNEALTPPTLFGCLLIVASGLFILSRGPSTAQS